MPWKVTDVMQERIRFVIQVLRDQENMSELWSYCQKLCTDRHQAATSSSRTPLMNFTFSMTSPKRR